MTAPVLAGVSVLSGNKLEWDLMRNQLTQVNAMAMRDLISIALKKWTPGLVGHI